MLGIKNVKISIESPNMNAYAERFIGSIRREALDWFVLVTEKQVENIVKKYIFYYNNYRMRQGINGVPIKYTPMVKGACYVYACSFWVASSLLQERFLKNI